jgi:hypothetical protein
MTKNKQITELKTEKENSPPSDKKQYAVEIDSIAMNGEIVKLGFLSEVDFQTWLDLNEKMRSFIDEVERGKFGK